VLLLSSVSPAFAHGGGHGSGGHYHGGLGFGLGAVGGLGFGYGGDGIGYGGFTPYTTGLSVSPYDYGDPYGSIVYYPNLIP
jgi:hypothetical protein